MCTSDLFSNWGCGAFGGFHDIKAIIQLMAASEVGRPLHYFSFREPGLAASLIELHALLTTKKATVGMLFLCHCIVLANNLMQETFGHFWRKRATICFPLNKRQTKDRLATTWEKIQANSPPGPQNCRTLRAKRQHSEKCRNFSTSCSNTLKRSEGAVMCNNKHRPFRTQFH
jgi:hypothetical protein